MAGIDSVTERRGAGACGGSASLRRPANKSLRQSLAPDPVEGLNLEFVTEPSVEQIAYEVGLQHAIARLTRAACESGSLLNERGQVRNLVAVRHGKRAALREPYTALEPYLRAFQERTGKDDDNALRWIERKHGDFLSLNMIPGVPRRNPMNGARGLTRQVAAEVFVFDGEPPVAAPDDPGPESDVRGSGGTRQAFTLIYDRSDIVKAARLAISGYVCANCGHIGGYHHHYEVDHIIPRSLGGDDSLQNTQVLCLFCHADKTWSDAGRPLVPVPACPR